jgi:beta-lactamase class D
MNKYLTDFEYGNMLIDSSMIDKFWLEGDFGISQFGQIAFLQKLYSNELPVSESTHNKMKEIMLTDELPGIFCGQNRLGYPTR